MSTSTTLLIVAGVFALGDWVAVALRRRRAQYVLKPVTLAVLVATAAVSDQLDGTTRILAVVALALGLVGDVAILQADPDEADGWFLAGLAAFLLGHAGYIATFIHLGVHGLETLGGALVAVGIGGLTLPRAIVAATRQRGRDLAVVLGAYAVVIAVMAAAAAGTTLVLTAVGAALFVVSDALVSRERFVARWTVRRVPAGEVAVMVTYHAAQGLILIGLLHPGVLHG